jgi:hypothetical protein
VTDLLFKLYFDFCWFVDPLTLTVAFVLSVLADLFMQTGVYQSTISKSHYVFFHEFGATFNYNYLRKGKIGYLQHEKGILYPETGS